MHPGGPRPYLLCQPCSQDSYVCPLEARNARKARTNKLFVAECSGWGGGWPSYGPACLYPGILAKLSCSLKKSLGCKNNIQKCPQKFYVFFLQQKHDMKWGRCCQKVWQQPLTFMAVLLDVFKNEYINLALMSNENLCQTSEIYLQAEQCQIKIFVLGM